MGIMDKVKFWDNEEDMDLDSELPPIEEDTPGQGQMGQNPASQGQDPVEDFPDRRSYNQEQYQDQGNQQNPFPQQNQQAPAQHGTTGNVQKDLELISSKLDAIKSELDSMDQRVRRIEKIALDEKEETGGRGRDPWANY